jgi:glycosyltransferase involved in cell wall biosynthesis
VKQRIWRAYRRSATVIYPPVDTRNFRPLSPRADYYVVLSRQAPHKKVDLIVRAFARLGLPLVVVGNGSESRRLARMAAPNIELLGWQPDETVRRLLGRAKALVHAAEEDFGIALVEAQAAGCPVIAFGRGGALETVIPGKTGLFFQEQSVESLSAAVAEFEAICHTFKTEDLRENAARFGKGRFQQQFAQFVGKAWGQFNCQE